MPARATRPTAPLMLIPSVKVDDIRAWIDALVASAGQAEITGSEPSFSAAAQVTQLRGAKIIPSPQTEVSEHEKDDDDGTD